MIHQKHKKSLEEITNDLCPVLSVQQLYRIRSVLQAAPACAICICTAHVRILLSGDSAPVAVGVSCRCLHCCFESCSVADSAVAWPMPAAAERQCATCCCWGRHPTGPRAGLCHILREGTSAGPKLKPAAPCSVSTPERRSCPTAPCSEPVPGCSPHLPFCLPWTGTNPQVLNRPICACPAAPCTGTTGTGLKR